MTVFVSTDLMNEVGGLLGNYDGVDNNEFINPAGQMVSECLIS